MNDPRPQTPPPPGDEPPQDAPPRKSSGTLVWLLILIAVMALGWYFFSQRGPTQAPDVPPTPIGTTPDIGDGTAPPPASERAPAASRPSAGITRDASPLAPIQPDYPPAALRARQEGSVLLQVHVDAQGQASDIEIVNSSRSRELDRAARDAVRSARFNPAMRDGQPIESMVNVPVDFRLSESATR